jgi:RNA polymerase sigma factor (sigma-70 family)
MPDLIDNEHLRNLLRTVPGVAIKILFDMYSSGLRAIARKLTQDDSVADDVVQEAFVYLWKNAHRLSELHDKSIQHYLVRIVRNRAVTQYKNSVRDAARKSDFFLEHKGQSKEDPFEAYLILNEHSQELRQLINSFPDRERECLLLKLDAQMTNDQIAKELEITQKAVERSITSAYKRLRKHFARR